MITGLSSRWAPKLASSPSDDFDIFDDVRASAGVGNIHQVHQQAVAFDVPQELRAQAGAGVRAFDQAGDVGDDEAFLVRLSPTTTTPRLGCSVVKG